MSGFLYAVPKTPDITPQSVGLGYAMTSSFEHRECLPGPTGGQCVILGELKRHEKRVIGYYPDQQTWQKLPAADGLPERHVGYWNDARPTPEDLERPNLLAGLVDAELGAGLSWHVPTLFELDEQGGGECRLPTREGLDADGHFVTLPPEGELGKLWDAVHPIALRLYGFPVHGEYLPPPTHVELRATAATILGANYVVSAIELALLGATFADDAPYERIIAACCRGQWLLDAKQQLQKKTE